MKPEMLIDDLDDCRGPCGKLCISCPEGWYLDTIKQCIVALMKERDLYRDVAQRMLSDEEFRQLSKELK